MASSARDFLDNVAIPFDGDECLIWPHKRKATGYGEIRVLGVKNKWVMVHRVVCEAVNGPPPSKRHQAAHSCGKGHEGCVSPKHLRWATPQENAADRIAHGTDNRGERNGRAKLTRRQAREILDLKGQMLHREIAEKFGVSDNLVSAIHTGRRWASLHEATG